MSTGRRLRDLVAGRHEFRVLVEIAVDRAEGLGTSRPIGGHQVEVLQVGRGSRARARLEALGAVSTRLADHEPDARVLAVLDGGWPHRPEPRLHLVRNGRPRLLLVGGESGPDVEQRLGRVVQGWGLPRGRYSLGRTIARGDIDRRLLPVVVGLAFGAPLFWVLISRSLWPPGAPGPVFDRIGTDTTSLVTLALVAVLPGALLAAASIGRGFRRFGRWWWTAGSAVGLPAIPLLGASLVDGITAISTRFPVVPLVAVGLLGLAAVPVLPSVVEGPRLRAAFGWGLPLLAGGVAPFVGEVLLDLYLSPFGIERSDVQVSLWAQWALGATATGGCLLAVYIGGGALWVILRRLGGPSRSADLVCSVVAIVYLVSAAAISLTTVEARSRVGPLGLPEAMIGLSPELVCLVMIDDKVPYIGAAVPSLAIPLVYLGRSDGRVAVWSRATGGVLLDDQAVSLRTIDPGRLTCS